MSETQQKLDQEQVGFSNITEHTHKQIVHQLSLQFQADKTGSVTATVRCRKWKLFSKASKRVLQTCTFLMPSPEITHVHVCCGHFDQSEKTSSLLFQSDKKLRQWPTKISRAWRMSNVFCSVWRDFPRLAHVSCFVAPGEISPSWRMLHAFVAWGDISRDWRMSHVL